ncbi:hypothetical protein B6R96_27575 [Streptomyces sp. Sge12]|uniref:hypothetical protein n=1 Tax=Streptomyces sp. Sge12 TaxID=1972846 RepID=UPI0009C3B896|nr:hypothetical protein [Streptomyces sp. Sge12]ARE77236.1 hypothetical protein B6R96_27575 [Streptomyces sp. Sge12]
MSFSFTDPKPNNEPTFSFTAPQDVEQRLQRITDLAHEILQRITDLAHEILQLVAEVRRQISN